MQCDESWKNDDDRSVALARCCDARRRSLGATPSRVVALIVRQGMWPVLRGVALGIVVAAGVTRVLATQLYGVGATDPLTFVGVAAVVALVAALTAALPLGMQQGWTRFRCS